MASVAAAAQELHWPEPIQRVQKLASTSLLSVPHKYVRPLSHRADVNAPPGNIPVIDLSGLADSTRRHETLQQIGQACEAWGFFHAINHGIPLSLIQNVRHVSQELFDLPYEEKEVYANKPGLPVGYGSHHGALNSGTVLEWSDFFFHQLIPFTSYDTGSWPKKPPAYRETVSEYGKQVFNLARILLLALAENLGLTFPSVEEAFGGENGLRLSFQINYYPPCPQPSLTLGAAPHSDAGILTVLLQDDVRGLQVCKDGAWYSVESVTGGLVVIVGDQLQIFSNGRYQSAEHQAVPNSKHVRMSWAAFLAPALDAVVSPAQQLLDQQHPPLYNGAHYREYISNVFSKGNIGKGYMLSRTLVK